MLKSGARDITADKCGSPSYSKNSTGFDVAETMTPDVVILTIEELDNLTEEVCAPGGPPRSAPHTKRINTAVVEALRAGRGKLGGELAGQSLLILTSTGRKSGVKRENPLSYFVIDERLFVVASMGGADTHPPWYLNIVARPEIAVEINGIVFCALATTVAPEEHQLIYRAVCTAIPVFTEYQQRTSRQIPVVELLCRREDLINALGDAAR